METPAGINSTPDPGELHPETDHPRFTALEQLLLAAAPIAGITRVAIEGIRSEPPRFFPGQATYLQERSSVLTVDGTAGGGPIHLVSISIPIQLADALRKAFEASRGTKLGEGLVVKTGDPELGGRVGVRGPDGEVQ